MFARAHARAPSPPSPRVSFHSRVRSSALGASRVDANAYAPVVGDVDAVQTLRTPTLLPGLALPRAQAAAFDVGVLLGLPWALLKIARDVRKQNIAERRRAKLAPVKSRVSEALDGRRAGRERAAKLPSASPRERRALTNANDIPIASNVRREAVVETRATAAKNERRAPTAAIKSSSERSATRIVSGKGTKRGAAVKVTLAVRCSLAEGTILGVVGDDDAMRSPQPLRRVGADRWQIVADIAAGELRYAYVAIRGDDIVREEGDERRQLISAANGPPLIIESNAPKFK